MEAKNVLEQLRFGQGVAESDRGLERYFVKTPAFGEIVRDEVDLILGVKGSGKTAISRVIASGNVDIPELRDVIPLSALSAQAGALFGKLPANADEFTMRQVWMAYLLSLVGSAVLSSGAQPHSLAEVERLLLEAELPARERSTSDGTMRDLLISLAPIPQTGGHPEEDTPAESPIVHRRWLSPGFDFEPLARALDGVLLSMGKRCWILLDRLDEAFVERPTVETQALRGLLRAHLDLLDLVESVRTKIFLRSDIFGRITQNSGFTNLDHFSQVTLRWRRADLLELVAERMRASPSFGELQAEGASSTTVVGRCIPPTITYFTGRKYSTSDAVDWCIEVTEARREEPSPRNLIRLIREAQRLGLSRLEVANPEYVAAKPLIHDYELINAWRILSSTRLFDTVYAENNHLRAYVEAFQHQTMRATSDTLASRFHAVSPSCEADQIMRDLEGIGFLHLTTPGMYDVSPLYMPALDIDTGNAKRKEQFKVVSSGHAESPERLRDAAKELSSQGQLVSAINLLVTGYSIPLENAILAANMAVESGSKDMLSKIDTLLERQDFADALLGKRIAVSYARDRSRRAAALSRKISDPEDLDAAFGHFVGSLTFDSGLERLIWKEVIGSRRWEAADASPWEQLSPVVAASRLLAVARSERGPSTFQDTARTVLDDWYSAGSSTADPDLVAFLIAYVTDIRTVPVSMFPYQVVSVAFVVRSRGELSTTLHNRLVEVLAGRVRSSAERHQRSFRDWAALDDLAREVADQMDR